MTELDSSANQLACLLLVGLADIKRGMRSASSSSCKMEHPLDKDSDPDLVELEAKADSLQESIPTNSSRQRKSMHKVSLSTSARQQGADQEVQMT